MYGSQSGLQNILNPSPLDHPPPAGLKTIFDRNQSIESLNKEGEISLGSRYKPTDNSVIITENIRSIRTQSDFAKYKQDVEKDVRVFFLI